MTHATRDANRREVTLRTMSHDFSVQATSATRFFYRMRRQAKSSPKFLRAKKTKKEFRRPLRSARLEIYHGKNEPHNNKVKETSKLVVTVQNGDTAKLSTQLEDQIPLKNARTDKSPEMERNLWRKKYKVVLRNSRERFKKETKRDRT